MKLLFQPCEEGRPSGARVMCEHGVMEGVDCVLMCHVNCGDPVHVVSCCSGVTNATSVAFKISLDGRAVHVASPHCGVDALAAGVKLYNGIQLLVSREVDPFDVCVMSVCTMHAGNTVATNAEHCELEGSIRCLKDDTMRWAMERLARLARADRRGGRRALGDRLVGEPLPSAHNDPALYAAFRASAEKVVGPERFCRFASLAGRGGFCLYEQRKPGLLFGLGMRNPAKGACHPAHTCDWDIDEDRAFHRRAGFCAICDGCHGRRAGFVRDGRKRRAACFRLPAAAVREAARRRTMKEKARKGRGLFALLWFFTDGGVAQRLHNQFAQGTLGTWCTSSASR